MNNYIGLTKKYPVNRPLSEQEMLCHLQQKKRQDHSPRYRLALTKFNSTYLESVDKYYQNKGFLSLFMLVISFILITAMIAFTTVLVKQWNNPYRSHTNDMASLLLAYAFLGSGVAGMLWVASKEFFRFTHYPIRLNRKNRMVYVFRLDGTVLAAPWDKIFFTSGYGGPTTWTGINKSWDIRGHVLDDDGKTVKETFSFCVGGSSSDDYKLLQHWEFLRRYMEEGPKELAEQVKYCWPITEQRESYKTGLLSLLLPYLPASIGQAIFMAVVLFLLIPIIWTFSLAVSLVRWLVMRTSKVPTWPREVEDACAIDKNDPYIRDASTNKRFPSPDDAR